MTPDQTQQILQLRAALWPHVPLTDDTVDAWAVALVPLDFDIARQTVIDYSRSDRGEWPPTVAVIAAADRSTKRQRMSKEDLRPKSAVFDALRMSAASAHQDGMAHARRVADCESRVGRDEWLRLLDEARAELVAEYGTNVIPIRLIANRACDHAEIP